MDSVPGVVRIRCGLYQGYRVVPFITFVYRLLEKDIRNGTEVVIGVKSLFLCLPISLICSTRSGFRS